MSGRKDGELEPIEVRRVDAEDPPAPPEAAPAPRTDAEEDHDGWQPVRPRRPSAPPSR